MPPEVAARNLEMLKSGEGADWEVRCGSKIFAVHKAIVWPALKAKLYGQVETDSFIRLYSDKESSVVEYWAMIMYLYTGEYDAGECLEKGDEGTAADRGTRSRTNFRTAIVKDAGAHDTEARMMVHIKVYSLADLYHITDLKQFALEKFQALTTDYWPYKDLEGMVDAVHNSKSPYDIGLRQVMRDVCMAHYEELMKTRAVWMQWVVMELLP
ncbi:hypothetical protein ACLMJK_004330 [Lecanora helva]